MRIPWRLLRIIDGKAIIREPWDFEVANKLDVLRTRSTRFRDKDGLSFLKHGFDHEDPSAPHTWGPGSSADVDWTGFEEALKEGKRLFEAKKRRKTA